jgi:protein TonB
MTDAALPLADSGSPRLLWATAFLAVLAVHIAACVLLLDRAGAPAASEAPEPIAMIELPPAPVALPTEAVLPPSETADIAPATRADAVATSVAPDQSDTVTEAAAPEDAPAERAAEPPAAPMLQPAPPPLVDMLQAPPPVPDPPAEPPPEPVVEETTPAVPEATVILPAVVPPPPVRPAEDPAPRPVRKAEAPKAQKPKERTSARAARRTAARSDETAGTRQAERTVAGRPKSGAAPRSGGGAPNANELARYLSRVRADIERQVRRISVGQAGSATVRFSFARDGRLKSAAIAASSGNAAIDRAVLEAVRNASPFPPAPESLSDREFRPTLPVRIKR